MSCTVWHAGTPSTASCRWGCRTTRRRRSVPSSMRASARSIWASFSRSLLSTVSSWSRSKLVAPMSAWSWPAPSPASRISPARSSSCVVQLDGQPVALLVQLGEHLLELGLGPALLALLDDERARGAALAARLLGGAPSWRGAFLAGRPSWPARPSWPGAAFFAGAAFLAGGLLRGRGLLGRAAFFAGAAFLAGAAFFAGRLLGRAPSWPAPPSWPGPPSSPAPPSWPGGLLGRRRLLRRAPSWPAAFFAGAAFLAAFVAAVGRGRGACAGRSTFSPRPRPTRQATSWCCEPWAADPPRRPRRLWHAPQAASGG